MAESRTKKLFVFSDADNCVYSNKYWQLLYLLAEANMHECRDFLMRAQFAQTTVDAEPLFEQIKNSIKLVDPATLASHSLTRQQEKLIINFRDTLVSLGLWQHVSSLMVKKANHALFRHIGEMAQNEKFTDAYWGTSSARSDRLYEWANATKNCTGIKVAELEHLVDEVRTYTGDLNWSIHPFMMADIYAKRKIGTTRHEILREIDETNKIHAKYLNDASSQDDKDKAILQLAKKFKGQAAHYLFDASKLSIYYVIAHMVARENPNAESTILIVDDSLDIFKAFKYSLTGHARHEGGLFYSPFFPENVRIIWQEYSGNFGHNKLTIKGSGIIDCALEETLPVMLRMCSFVKNPRNGRYISSKNEKFDPPSQLKMTAFIEKRDAYLANSAVSRSSLFAVSPQLASDSDSSSCQSGYKPSI